MPAGSRSTLLIWAVAGVLAVLAGTAAPPGGAAPPAPTQAPEAARVALVRWRAARPTRRAELTLVNLASRLQDGQQIVVPEQGATAVAPGGAASIGAAGSSAPVHLSTATVEQLDAIDGIGPTLAERIIEFRDERGGFRSLDELSQVDGIGEKRPPTLREALQP